MPQQNGNVVAGQLAVRTARPAQARVLPAIPLALSRPKAANKTLDKKSIPAISATSSDTRQTLGEEGDRKAVAHVDANGAGSAGVQKEPLQVRENGQKTDTSNLQNGVTSVVTKPDQQLPPTVKSTPSPATAATPVANVKAARKSVQKNGVRSIKTELPPAFVPASEHGAPQLDSSQRPYEQSMTPMHSVQPSAGSIIFGGHDSSHSSPAPPPGAGSSFMPPPYQGQPFQFTHAHHSSEPSAPRPGHYTHPQPPSAWSARQGFAPPQQFYSPHAQVPFRYPPRETFTPGASVLPNGNAHRSRSGSHTSSMAADGQRSVADLHSPMGVDQVTESNRLPFHEQKIPYPGPGRHLPPQHMPPPPIPNFLHPEMAASFENAESMRDHVLSQFRDPELADCHLQITEEEGSGRQYLDAHKLILARSPKLLELIRNSSAPASATLKTQVHVALKGRHVRAGTFVDAVRYLYGGPLPPSESFNLGPHASSVDRIEVALSYIATGAWLNIHAFAQRGVEIAMSLVQCDTLPTVLAFALEGGLGQMWSAEDGSEERTSTCSSDDSFGKPETGGSPTYDPHSSALLSRALDFIVHNLPPSFYLNPAAPQSTACPRLPSPSLGHESTSSRSDPRLSRIRFGEMSVEDHQRPSFVTTTISSVLLSLPFPLLKYLLEHPVLTGRLGSETVASIMRQVVNEREVRRQRALTRRTMGREDSNMSEAQQVQNLFWEESVEPSLHHRAGFRLARRRRGIDTPPSSSTDSERNK